MGYKLKSHRGAAKRFKKTANGFKHQKAKARHNLTKRTTKVKRELRGNVQVTACDVPHVQQMLPYC